MRGGRLTAWGARVAALVPALPLDLRPWVRPIAALVGWCIVVYFMFDLYVDELYEHLDNSLDPKRFNDDVRQQIPPFYRFFGDNRAFDHDYIYGYYYDAFPIGYKLLYTYAARWGIDPQRMSGWLPLVLHVATAALLMVSADRFGGKPSAFAIGCLWLASGAFHQLVGGLPRAFGFPIVALAILALTLGRPRILALAAILGAGFYPMVGALSGLTLAFWLLLLPARHRGVAASWSVRRRVGELAVAGTLAVLVIVPSFLNTRKYGDIVRPHDEIIYPEAGSKGRLNPIDRPPFNAFIDEATTWIRGYVIKPGEAEPFVEQPRKRLSRDHGEPYRAAVAALLGLSLAGFIASLRTNAAAVRIVLLLMAAFVAYVLAKPVLPLFYLPSRYPKFTAPPLMMLFVSVGALGLLSLGRHGPLQRMLCSTSLAVVVLALLGADVDPKRGLSKDLKGQVPLLEFVAELPDDVVLAGVPGGPIENVPFYSRRGVLITRETHQPFHHGFVVETRERMNDFIDAYWAAEEAPIRALMERHHVTHLIVRPADFRGKPPKYHAPFRERITEIHRKHRGSYLMLDLLEPGSIFEHEGHHVVDLEKALADYEKTPDEAPEDGVEKAPEDGARPAASGP